MFTAALKQHVRKRSSRKQKTRFKLLVDGRFRGIWEKKKGTAGLALSRHAAEGRPAPPGGRSHFLLKRLPFGACLLIWMVVFLGMMAAPAAMTPLPLPPEKSPLAHSFAENLSASPVGPAIMPNLKLIEYRVRARDTLPAIAKRHNLNIDTIISFNAIHDARQMKAGTRLIIPNKRGLSYRVRSGDSLSIISKRFAVPLNDLLDWNNLASSVIDAGRNLFLPNARLSAAEINKVMGTFFAWPTKGSISSFYGMRISPVTGTRHHHNGVDIRNRRLTSVLAAAGGRVAIVDYNPTYGNFIILMHDDGFQSLYGHLEDARVKKGQIVSQGERIGRMGSTGASTGWHLHFSIFKNGRDVDPMKYLPP